MVSYQRLWGSFCLRLGSIICRCTQCRTTMLVAVQEWGIRDELAHENCCDGMDGLGELREKHDKLWATANPPYRTDPSSPSPRILPSLTPKEDCSARLWWIEMCQLCSRPHCPGVLDWGAEDCEESAQGITTEGSLKESNWFCYWVQYLVTVAWGSRNSLYLA